MGHIITIMLGVVGGVGIGLGLFLLGGWWLLKIIKPV